jgi:apolipoprotein N-acyltransferase
LLYGRARLERYDRQEGEKLTVALIQGNIAQDAKWDPSFLDETMNIYSRLTLAAAEEKPALVVWPEAATPFFFQSQKTYQEKVAALTRRAGAYLLLGSPACESDGEERRYFNSAFLVSPDGTITGRYDKMHLVPYGEYVPLKPLFPFIDKMVVGIGDFSSGSEVKNLHFPGGTFGTLICYEIIFPDLVRRFAKNGAEFLVNITNDAWFGSTAAPYQHLSMAALRAVENRRCVARAANTGISAIIGASGRIVQHSKLFTPQSLTGIISLNRDMTFYTRRGDIFALLCTFLSLAVLGITFITARGRSKQL